MDKSIYVIGDVHGAYRTLLALLEKIPNDAIVVFTGDLVDRGPNSKEVIELIMNNDRFLSVQGNHEVEFLGTNFAVYGRHVKPKFRFSDYREYVNPTFKSYKSGDVETFHKHRTFLRKLPLFLKFEFDNAKDLIVSHSFILPKWKGENEEDYDYDDRTFIQYAHIVNPSGQFKYLDYKHDSLFNIFGHTAHEGGPLITDSWACVDTGGVFQGGKLTALKYPEMEVIQQDSLEHEIVE